METCVYSHSLTKESRTASVDITTGTSFGALRRRTTTLTASGECAFRVSYPVNILVFLAESSSQL